ncbi:MAG: hypothetical protein ABGX27_00845 [Desulfurobacteriaceae bacterium]
MVQYLQGTSFYLFTYLAIGIINSLLYKFLGNNPFSFVLQSLLFITLSFFGFGYSLKLLIVDTVKRDVLLKGYIFHLIFFLIFFMFTLDIAEIFVSPPPPKILITLLIFFTFLASYTITVKSLIEVNNETR